MSESSKIIPRSASYEQTRTPPLQDIIEITLGPRRISIFWWPPRLDSCCLPRGHVDPLISAQSLGLLSAQQLVQLKAQADARRLEEARSAESKAALAHEAAVTKRRAAEAQAKLSRENAAALEPTRKKQKTQQQQTQSGAGSSTETAATEAAMDVDAAATDAPRRAVAHPTCPGQAFAAESRPEPSWMSWDLSRWRKHET